MQEKILGKCLPKGIIKAKNKCQNENLFMGFGQFLNVMIIHTLCNQTTACLCLPFNFIKTGCDRHLLGLATIAEELGLPKPLLYQDKSFTKRYFLINKKNISWYKDAKLVKK